MKFITSLSLPNKVPLGDLHSIDMKTKMWTEIVTKGPSKTPFKARIHTLTCYTRNHLVVLGALETKDIWIFNLSNLQWSKLKGNTLPSTISAHCTVLAKKQSKDELVVVCLGGSQPGRDHKHNDKIIVFDVIVDA